MNGTTFYMLTLSFFVGIFVASFIMLDRTLLCLGFILVSASAAYGILCARKEGVGKQMFFGCTLFFMFICGALRFSFSESPYHPLDSVVGTEVILEGLVYAETEMKEVTQRVRFKSDTYTDKLILSISRYPEYVYGDRIRISGVLELPENFETYEGGPEFDYISYLAKDGVRYVMSRPVIEKLGSNEGNFIVSGLINIKGMFMNRIERLMPEPHSSLVVGILLGEKGSLPEDVGEDFRRSGLTHILVLSGSNVSVVVGSLIKIFSFLPRILGQSLGGISIVLFALMTGASATTIRASFMALIFVLAGVVGRRYDVTRALVIAAFIMLLHNPRILAFDIGFQLSFLATLALIYVSPIVTEKLSWVTERFGLREIFSTSIATQIFTLPFILYSMGEISLISLVTNILVLPVVSWSMLGGFITGMLGFLGPFIALPFAWVTTLIIGWMIWVVSVFGPLPFATAKLSIGEPVLIVLYLFYLWFIVRWRRKNSAQQSANSNS